MKKTMYIKRFFAVFVSAAMLTSMTPEVLAESFSVSESTASESAEDIAAWNTESNGEPDAPDGGTGFVDGGVNNPRETKNEIKSLIF